MLSLPCISLFRSVRCRGRRLLTLGFVGAISLLSTQLSPKPGAATEQAPVTLPQAIEQLDAALASLEMSLAKTPANAERQPGGQPLSPRQLFTDGRELHKRKLYGAAATLLTESLARSLEPDFSPEALFLLGDSLAEQGEIRGAQRYWSQLVDSKSGDPRALLKLLALSAQLPENPSEKQWIVAWRALPPDRYPDEAAYIVGKLLFLRDDLAAAQQLLETVGPQSAFHVRARYVLAATLVQQKKLDAAETVFRAIVNGSLPRRDDDVRVRELAQLALGRIYHERRDGKQAHEAYLGISQKSNLFKDAVYEASWAALSVGDAEKAEQSLNLLLVAYRDDPATVFPVAEARLLLGDLLLRKGEPDRAAAFFVETRNALRPLVEQIKTDVSSSSGFLDRVEKQLGSSEGPLTLARFAPKPVVISLGGDAVVTQLQAMDRELYATDKTLTEQEHLLRQTEWRMKKPQTGLAGADLSEPRNRSLTLYRYLFALHRAGAERLDALFGSVATPEEKQQLETFANKRSTVGQGLSTPQGGNDMLDGTSSARRAHAGLIEETNALYLHLLLRLPSAQKPQAEAVLSSLTRLVGVEKRLVEVIGKLDRVTALRFGNLQEQLDAERGKLREQRDALAKLRKETAQLHGAKTLARLAQMADKYGELLAHAESGVAEVAWAKRQKTSDELAQIQADQARELKLLDEAFGSDEDGKTSGKTAPDAKNVASETGKVDATALRATTTARGDESLPNDTPPELRDDYRRYFEAAQAYKRVVYEVGREGYKKRRVLLKAEFAQRLNREQQRERELADQAILALQDFLTRYPQHSRFSPDAIIRLAELLFERTNETFISQSKQQTGEIVSLPDYSPSVDLYRRLLRDFPAYRDNHLATYLLGYCLGEMNHDEEARQAFLGLLCQNKYSALDSPAPPVGRKAKPPYEGCVAMKSDEKLLAETWTRLGEYHFDRGELEAAIFSYEQAIPHRDSPYFDKALYKLAWSFYRADRFSDAVKRFDQLVTLADQKKLGDPGKKEGFALRTESVQYLALSFAEPDWDGDGKDDPVAGLARAESFYKDREGEKHTREVFQRMGDVFFDRTEFARAADAYRMAIATWPLAPENPRLQERIVLAMERLRNFEQALREREQLARAYMEGSDWAKQNRDNETALVEGLKLADLALMNVVLRRHESAQKLREEAQSKNDSKLRAQAIEEYRQAAVSYETYLKQHPNSKDKYEYSYYLAESLFFGEKYLESAEAYEKVRDMDPKGKYIEDSAYGVIKSREFVVSAFYKESGQIEPPIPQVGKFSPPILAINLPEEVAKLQSAYDRFVSLLPDSPKNPLFSYKSGEIDLRYLRFPQMRTRMSEIVNKFCKDERAVDAGNALLVSYNIEGDLEKLEEWTSRLKNRNCGGTSQIAKSQQGNIQKLSQQVRFKKAEQFLSQKRYSDAAALFIELVAQEPHGPDADKALFNAAVAFESDRRYGTATETYERIVKEYPQSKLVDESLFRAAVNHQRFFDFDKAVVAYQQVGTEPRFKNSPHRQNALYNAALIAENDQRYSLAADLWKQYAQSEKTTAEEAATAYFRAALSIEKQGPAARAEQEFSQFVARYEQKAGSLHQVVEARSRLARAQQKLGNVFDANENFKRAAQLGQKLPAGSDAAEYAAEAAFLLAEQKLQEVERQKIGGSGKELENSISAFNKKVQETLAIYDRVLSYKRANHTLAAYFRMGYVFELYAKAFLAAPCPPEVKRLGMEACDLYRNKIEENVAGIEEKALQRYAVTLEQAAKLGVANRWTKLARQRANAYRPDTYPLTKDEHVSQQLIVPSPLQPADGSELAKLSLEARSSLQSRQYENSIVLAKLALAKDDRHVPAMLTLASAYYYLGKRELSAAIVGIAQTIDANNADSYLVLGFLALAKEDRIAATAAFKKATEIDPASGLAWHNLSAMYLLAKNYEQALFACERSTVLLPGLSGTQLNYGSALRGMKRYVEAETAYKRVQTVEPQNVDAMFNLGILYLDASSMPGFDAISQRLIAIRYLENYVEITGPRGGKDEAAEAYIKEARAAIEREQRRQKKKTGSSVGGPS